MRREKRICPMSNSRAFLWPITEMYDHYLRSEILKAFISLVVRLLSFTFHV
ncbi:hypothetical protein RvY_02053 [Ramazzottius varieornatus]|uniref:Uncharacterized protein n=1 Tax=Ramazzottius varieornatus TaxID=947166 RepID=A0A1D1UIG2_RAMVA|nr:hypothetical protein RvY_02053 [Ramazzottius varieornatus]